MKQKVLVDVSVTCEPPYSIGRWSRTIESKAKELESWAREFEEFLRDHRSQDPISINVERVYQDQCSHCGSEWEIDSDGVPACCNKAVEEFEALSSEKK